MALPGHAGWSCCSILAAVVSLPPAAAGDLRPDLGAGGFLTLSLRLPLTSLRDHLRSNRRYDAGRADVSRTSDRVSGAWPVRRCTSAVTRSQRCSRTEANMLV